MNTEAARAANDTTLGSERGASMTAPEQLVNQTTDDRRNEAFPDLPPYRGGVRLDRSTVGAHLWVDENGMQIQTPDWVRELIIVQANIAKVTQKGSFASSIPVLDHLRDMGVNGLWVTPFFENQGNANKTSHYGNQGPQTLAADTFEAHDHAGRVKELQDFVRAAHKRGIYVFADVVTYGVLATSPIYRAYLAGEPFQGLDVSGWFTGEPAYSGYRFRWESETLRAWFEDRMVDLCKTYDLDGFRVDSEPCYLYYDADGDGEPDTYDPMFARVRMRVAGYERGADGVFYYPENGSGREIAVFSEKNNLRTYGYDFEQYGVIHYGDIPHLGCQTHELTRKDWFCEESPVRSIKEGLLADGRGFCDATRTEGITPSRFPYYTYCVSNQDSDTPVMRKRLWVGGYQAILAPFIPIWYYGEECGLEHEVGTWLNALPVRVEVLLRDRDNRAFYEQLRALIGLRRRYPALFAPSGEDIRKSNIEELGIPLPGLGYLRTGADRLAVIAANPTGEPLECDVSFDIRHLPDGCTLAFTDMLGEGVLTGTRDGDRVIIRDVTVPGNGVTVLMTTLF